MTADSDSELLNEILAGRSDTKTLDLAELTEGAHSLQKAMFETGLIRPTETEESRLNSLRVFLIELFQYAASADSAVEFLVRNDLVDVIRRIQVLELLRDPFIPFFSLCEMSEHLQSFQQLLHQHKDYLVQTGLMPVLFEQCVWLDSSFRHLYDTRTTSSTRPREQHKFRPSESNEHESLGSKQNQDNSLTESSAPFTWVKYSKEIFQLSDIVPCEYEDASLLYGLTNEDADRLESLRPRNFEVRTRILEIVLSALTNVNGATLLEDCLTALESEFNAEETLFLFEKEMQYLNLDSDVVPPRPSTPNLMPGGLTNLVEVAGQAQFELRHRLLDRLVNAIGSEGREIIVSSECALHGYLELLKLPNARTIEDELKVTFQNQGVVQNYWDGLNLRFRSWIAPNYTVPFTLPINGRYFGEISKILPSIANSLHRSLEAGLSPFPITDQEPPWFQSTAYGMLVYNRQIRLNQREKVLCMHLCENSGQRSDSWDIAHCWSEWKLTLLKNVENSDALKKRRWVPESTSHQIRDALKILRKALREAFRLTDAIDPIPNTKRQGWKLDLSKLDGAKGSEL